MRRPSQRPVWLVQLLQQSRSRNNKVVAAWGSGEISQQDGAREVENMEVSSGASLSFSEIRPAERDMLGALAETVLC